MGNLKRKYNRFIFKHKDKGIPNLMLWIVLGNILVYVYDLISGTGILYNAMCFNMDLILRGQVWRLLSYIFLNAYNYGNIFFLAISMLFYYNMGRSLEMVWGTLRLNLYYLCGVLLMDVAGVLGWLISPATMVYINSTYLNLSLFLAVATLDPDRRVLFFFFLPIRMKWLAFFDLIMSLVPLLEVLIMMLPLYGFSWSLVFYALFPVVAILNYFIFLGRDVRNVLPDWMNRKRPKKNYRTTAQTPPQPDPNWANKYRSSTGQRPYRHKCTVCGRTDTNCPGLEFRYCSKCKGYFCYCIDHINNHNHVE
ncbi:MAG: rhomboid family intramembrane serine protease [Oscillospiraceae bacterium]|nr:rhomboid family intramembrane serine protease [Oscillospiraceae bacterium]